MWNNDPPSADEDVAKLRLVLRNTSLTTLEKHGLVTYDRDENIVRKGPQFDTINMLSNSLDDYDGCLPDEWR